MNSLWVLSFGWCFFISSLVITYQICTAKLSDFLLCRIEKGQKKWTSRAGPENVGQGAWEGPGSGKQRQMVETDFGVKRSHASCWWSMQHRSNAHILEILYKSDRQSKNYYLFNCISSSLFWSSSVRKKKTSWNQKFSHLTFVLWNTSEGLDILTSQKNSSGWMWPLCPAKDCFWKCGWKTNQMWRCVWLVSFQNSRTKRFAVKLGVWRGGAELGGAQSLPEARLRATEDTGAGLAGTSVIAF